MYRVYCYAHRIERENMVDDVVNENIYLKKNRNKSSHLHGTYTQMNEKEKNHFYLCLHCTVMYDVRADSTGFLCVEIFHSHFFTHTFMHERFIFVPFDSFIENGINH